MVIYELPHELPNDLRLKNLKTSLNDSLVSSLPTKMKILLILGKTLEKQELNFSRSALFYIKTRVHLKYFVDDCLWKKTQTPSNMIFLRSSIALKPFTQF